ncbi:hypothetical protein [Flavobacterium gelatinilyticum]|uniref:hypothetical protein n=1 Tax=Flavobacterium gelatinilyticum TaxID=3003260 RepID=UPI0024802340|nr:hypothetical protein [Flavobacterium gelatinilyticum]
MNTATPEQIAEWKKQHVNVYALKSIEAQKICYLRKPTRQELSYASTAGAKDPLKFNEHILKSCWLAGDEEIQTNDSLFLGISAQLDTICAFEHFELEKL